jgi:triacylglycerol lipase
MVMILQFVLFVFLVSVGVSFFTYSFFWYENAGTFRTGETSRRRYILPILQGFLSAIPSLMLLLVTYPLGYVRSFWKPRQIDSSQPVIVLTHGLYHNASAWLLFKFRLQRAGYRNIFVMNYRSFFTSFDGALDGFSRFMQEVVATVPNQPVYLIGHSLGGLISRVYAERSHEGEAPAGVITLGTPHQGSKMAAFGVGKLAAGLIYRGPLFQELERISGRLPCAGTALYSPVDNLVMPSDGLKASYTGWTYLETCPVSHVAMLYSQSITKRVIGILREATIAR